MVRVKRIAQSYAWRPGVDKEIEQLVKSCNSYQKVQKSPESAVLHPWIWPSKPRVTFAGPFQGKMFLIAVDSFSKWPEIVEMLSTTTGQTVKVLQDVFARHDLPEQLVSNNGP